MASLTALQPAAAPAHWLRHQPSPRSSRVWIATDPDHTARAVVLARIALGSQGGSTWLGLSVISLLE